LRHIAPLTSDVACTKRVDVGIDPYEEADSVDTLIANVTAVTMNKKMEVLFGSFIGVTNGKITYIGKKPPEETPETIIDGTGMVAMPGLVNCHTHLATTLLRNYFDDCTNAEALDGQLQKMAKLDKEGAKASALLGIAECLRFGITSVSDLSEQAEAVLEAIAEAGIKGNVALAANRFADENEEFDFEADPQCQLLCKLTDQYNGYDNGRIAVEAGIHAEYTGNCQLWEGLADYALEKNLGVQLHLAETDAEAEDCLERTGLYPGELLNCHNFFRTRATAAGCAGLSEEELALLGKKGVTAVVTPIANGKAGLPVAKVKPMVKAGMNVALGTGGGTECGNTDLFESMRALAGAVRTSDGDAGAMPASALLMMATLCGARAQGRSENSGMLEENMDADIVLVDFTAPHLMPCHNVTSGLVFSAKGGDVAMTMVRGKILYQNGKFPTIDLGAVVDTLMQKAIPAVFENKE